LIRQQKRAKRRAVRDLCARRLLEHGSHSLKIFFNDREGAHATPGRRKEHIRKGRRSRWQAGLAELFRAAWTAEAA
jgi:hypothetical protein